MHNKKPLSEQSPCLAGMEHIKRFWDGASQTWTAKILPGEFYVSKYDEAVGTVLGSCISACIRDKVMGIGGMNHFMLPAQHEFSSIDWGSEGVSSASRYGNFAMEYLINTILSNGGSRKNLEVKLFGGGQVLANLTDIGQRNILFAYDYLNKEGLKIVAADVGDVYPRKVIYFPQTGKVLVKRLGVVKNDTIARRENKYMKDIEQTSNNSGDIELFD
jgi:chemotaxis protein CheD